MRVYLHFRLRDKHPGEYRSGNRVLSLAYSLMLHAGVVLLLFGAPRGAAPDRPLYQSVIVPLQAEHKIIYYNLRKQLPDVSATNPTAAETKAASRHKARQTMVTAPRAREGKQFVYIPAPKIELQTELRAPNIITFQAPVVPPPEKPKTKAFRPPPAETPAARSAPAALPAAPTLAASGDEKPGLNDLLKPAAGPRRQFVMPPAKDSAGTGAPAAAIPAAPTLSASTNPAPVNPLDSVIKPVAAPRKQFVMPTTSTSGARAGTTAAVPAPPTLATAGNSTGGNSLDDLIQTAAPRRRFVAPPASRSTGADGTAAAALPAPPAVQASGTVGSTNLAIISLTPTNTPRIPAPEGRRPEQLSTGLQSGSPHAELGNGNSPIAVPNVAIEGNAANPAQTASITKGPMRGAAKGPGVAVPRMPGPVRAFESPHVSVPQWPNNRRLPAPIEQHFRNRVVYMTVLPGQQVEADWIVWFGEQEATAPGARVLMRPPTLLQSAALPTVPAQGEGGTEKIRVTGIIRKDGRLDSCKGLAGSTVDTELVAALQHWQFKPALRNGVAVDVDAVIEIPLLFATARSR